MTQIMKKRTGAANKVNKAAVSPPVPDQEKGTETRATRVEAPHGVCGVTAATDCKQSAKSTTYAKNTRKSMKKTVWRTARQHTKGYKMKNGRHPGFLRTTFLAGLSGLILVGCSATTLRCGVDAETSYVDLVNVPQDMSTNSRNFAALCGFAYEEINQ